MKFVPSLNDTRQTPGHRLISFVFNDRPNARHIEVFLRHGHLSADTRRIGAPQWTRAQAGGMLGGGP
jgi:hypothetical protein